MIEKLNLCMWRQVVRNHQSKLSWFQKNPFCDFLWGLRKRITQLHFVCKTPSTVAASFGGIPLCNRWKGAKFQTFYRAVVLNPTNSTERGKYIATPSPPLPQRETTAAHLCLCKVRIFNSEAFQHQACGCCCCWSDGIERMISESPGSVILRTETRKNFPHAVPNSMLLPV